MAKQAGWLRVLQLVEEEQYPLTQARLEGFLEIDGYACDVPWMFQHLWPVITNNITHSLHTHRVAMAGGEKTTGLKSGDDDSSTLRVERKKRISRACATLRAFLYAHSPTVC